MTMGRTRKPAKAYRPRGVNPQAHLMAIQGAALLTRDDRVAWLTALRDALAAVRTGTVAGFAAYVGKHHSSDATTVFVDADTLQAVAVLNLGTPTEPGHADDTATLKPKATAAYSALLAHASGQPLAQRQAAEFLEDWQAAITCAKDGTPVPVPQAIDAVRSITIDAQRKGTNTEQSLGATRGVFESIQAGSVRANRATPARSNDD